MTKRTKRKTVKVGATIPNLRKGSKLYHGATMLTNIRPFQFRHILATKYQTLYKIVGSTSKMWILEEVLIGGKSKRRPWEDNPIPDEKRILKTHACTNTNKDKPLRDWFYTLEEYGVHENKEMCIDFIRGDHVDKDAVDEIAFLVESLIHDATNAKEGMTEL